MEEEIEMKLQRQRQGLGKEEKRLRGNEEQAMWIALGKEEDVKGIMKKKKTRVKGRRKRVEEFNTVRLKCIVKVSNTEKHQNRKRTYRESYQSPKGKVVI